MYAYRCMPSAIRDTPTDLCRCLFLFVARPYACVHVTYSMLYRMKRNTSNLRLMASARHLVSFAIWPIFIPRIFEFGVRVKEIIKRRRWVFLARLLIS